MTYASDERRPPRETCKICGRETIGPCGPSSAEVCAYAPRRLQREIHDRQAAVALDDAELAERDMIPEPIGYVAVREPIHDEQLAEAVEFLDETTRLIDSAADEVLRQAEAIVRPYLTTGAVFGVTPSHRFRNREMDPMHLVGAIAKAIEAARLTGK